MRRGSLTIVGSGIRLSQLSPEARGHIETAEKLFYLLVDPVTHCWLTGVDPDAESLDTCYSPDKPRHVSYEDMVVRIMAPVREGRNVCVVFYGHPGIFVYPGHEAIRRARLEGHRAIMLPGISAEDCLFADVGIDPATNGCQSFEATHFLAYRRRFDTCVPLILWQIGMIGNPGPTIRCDVSGLEILLEVLIPHYGVDHQVVIYQASQFVGIDPWVQRISLERVPQATLTVSSTLFVPAKEPPVPDAAMADRLKIPPIYFERRSNGLAK